MNFYGKTISKVEVGEVDGADSLDLFFTDGTGIKIYDDGQCCCESRYMIIDDNIQSLIGHKLLGIEEKKIEEADEEYFVHEICFVEVKTDQGFITIRNHNEHNGYYGGFGLEIEEMERD